MKTNNIFRWMSLLPALALTGCLQELEGVDDYPTSLEDTPILINVGIGQPKDDGGDDEATTRTVETSALNYTGFSVSTGSSGDAANSKVKVWVDNGKYTDYKAYSYKITSEKTIEPAGTGTAVPHFTGAETDAHIFAVYPDYNITQSAITSGTFTIQADQSSKEKYCLSDLMFSNMGTSKRDLLSSTATPAQLNFTHMLSRITINVNPSGVTIKKVEINNVPITVNLKTDGTKGSMSLACETNTSGTKKDVTLNSTNITTTTTLAAVIPPHSHTGNLVTITLSDDKTVVYDLGTMPKNFNSNTVYTLNLDVTTRSIGQVVDISKWGNTTGGLTILVEDAITLEYPNTMESLASFLSIYTDENVEQLNPIYVGKYVDKNGNITKNANSETIGIIANISPKAVDSYFLDSRIMVFSYSNNIGSSRFINQNTSPGIDSSFKDANALTGYQATQWLINHTKTDVINKPAISADEYNTTVPLFSSASRWFLPSSGQIKQIKLAGREDGNLSFTYYFNSSTGRHWTSTINYGNYMRIYTISKSGEVTISNFWASNSFQVRPIFVYPATKTVSGTLSDIKLESVRTAENFNPSDYLGKYVASNSSIYNSIEEIPIGYVAIGRIAYINTGSGDFDNNLNLHRNVVVAALSDFSDNDENYFIKYKIANTLIEGTNTMNDTSTYNGLAITNELGVVKEADGTTPTYPAAYWAVCTASQSTWRTNNSNLPTNISSWFIPTVQQWNDMLDQWGGAAKMFEGLGLNTSSSYWTSTEKSTTQMYVIKSSSSTGGAYKNATNVRTRYFLGF